MKNNSIEIKSSKGIYEVLFVDNPFTILNETYSNKNYYIIDKNVSAIYSKELAFILNGKNNIIIEANEENKDLTCFASYAQLLVDAGVKRDCVLVAIGGGVIQDITCFLATTLFRGMDWYFYPTTLLAQADSCIGSKSSINVAGIKNLMGTFTPPNKIFLAVSFLKTLSSSEILSGIGEMIKVHGIGGIQKLKEFNHDFEMIISDSSYMNNYIYKSLLIKKEIIEQDEFDKGIRNIMNYGHTFGHAIESATAYKIPHGIAVTIGQGMASAYSYQHKFISKDCFEIVKDLANKNLGNSKDVKINFRSFFDAIKKDKKNIDQKIAIIIPTNDNFEIEKKLVDANLDFEIFCKNYFVENGFSLI